jgi:hypothetical protein
MIMIMIKSSIDTMGSGFRLLGPWNLCVYIITTVGGSVCATCPISHHTQQAALLCADKPLEVLLPGNSNRIPINATRATSASFLCYFFPLFIKPQPSQSPPVKKCDGMSSGSRQDDQLLSHSTQQQPWCEDESTLGTPFSFITPLFIPSV